MATNGKAGEAKGRKPFLFQAAEAGVIGSKIVSHGGENRFLLPRVWK
jgi:hypothetical protein